MEFQIGDHCGPEPDSKDILMVKDRLTKFPKVKEVISTSADANVHALNDLFSRYSPPKVFLTDGGPTWNTNLSYPRQKYFAKMGLQRKATRYSRAEGNQDPNALGTQALHCQMRWTAPRSRLS